MHTIIIIEKYQDLYGHKHMFNMHKHIDIIFLSICQKCSRYLYVFI